MILIQPAYIFLFKQLAKLLASHIQFFILQINQVSLLLESHHNNHSKWLKQSFSTLQTSYTILGITSKTSFPQVKKKYYELAKIYHPDVNKDQQAHKKFTQITKAYQLILQKGSDTKQQTQQQPEKQKHNPFKHSSQKAHKAAFQQDWEDFDTYDSFFKGSKKFKKAKRGQDIYVNATISLKQSVHGIKKKIAFTRKQNCPQCFQKPLESCFPCGGKGQIFNRRERKKIRCQSCEGKGYKHECQTCNNSQFISKDVSEQIYIEKGTHDKTILRVQGNGSRGFRHDNGDLYVTVLIEQSQHYYIDGNNIHSQLEIQYLKAVFGGKEAIETVHGLKQVQIDAGTQSGSQLRLFNYGLKSAFSKRVGDHIVKIKIKIPEILTLKQKQLLSELEN